MAYLIWVVRILLFLVLLGLATHNLDSVHVRGLFGLEWQAPMALVLLVVFSIGTLLGALVTVRLTYALRQSPDRDNALAPVGAVPSPVEAASLAYTSRAPVPARPSAPPDDAGI